MDDVFIDKNLLIITLVEERSLLYNKKLDDYKNNTKKQKAWEKISERYNLFCDVKESGKFLLRYLSL